MQAYGFNVKTMTESQCVAELFKLYADSLPIDFAYLSQGVGK
jgi:hypothetical protein